MSKPKGKPRPLPNPGPRKILIGVVMCLILLFTSRPVLPYMDGKEAHERYIYPIVRVAQGMSGGSGTVVYSYLEDQYKGANIITDAEAKAGVSPYYSTYVLTNYHVIDGAISITEEWDTDLQKEVKKEKRDLIYVEIFKYRELSTPIGTLKVEAEIVLYNKDEDMALIKLKTEESVTPVALLLSGKPTYRVMDETVASGCSLGFPPLPTTGVITRLNFQIDSLPYDMSSSQIIYGNSGGAMFLAETGEFIGIPSKVPVVGWGTVVMHMGLFIPAERIYDWLEKEHYDFIYDPSKTEKECLELREKEIEEKKKKD